MSLNMVVLLVWVCTYTERMVYSSSVSSSQNESRDRGLNPVESMQQTNVTLGEKDNEANGNVRDIILAAGFGFLSGFVGGTILSVVVVFGIFLCNAKGTFVYDRNVRTYRAAEQLSLDEYNL